MNNSFPVDEICPQLCHRFAHDDIILTAPPGAGKSTRVPLALLRAFPNKRFLLLQPRRVVVKHLSSFLAKQLHEDVGQTIGYRMRGDSQVSTNTRLTLVTEGVLTRMLQDDPELKEVDGILFDEFHERSIHADLGLAFALECQQLLRADLRLLVMSATLDVAALKRLLPQATLLQSQGRMFDVALHYQGDCRLDALSVRIAETVQLCLTRHHSGNVLVFLPSARLIRECQRLLQNVDAVVHPLYGALSLQQQQQAIRPSQTQRSVILATNIAETSLTIEGVSVVIDSGREQQAAYDSRSALTTLTTKMISQPASIQRMGRAGRLSTGYCYRMWSASQQERLSRAVRPAIKEVDLTPHLLDVLVWGTTFNELQLIDKPDAAQLTRANNTMRLLGFVDAQGRLTKVGRDAHASGFQPRVAAMLMQCRTQHQTMRINACIAACLIEHTHLLRDTLNVIEDRAALISWVQPAQPLPHRTFKQALAFCHVPKVDFGNMNIATVAAAFAIAYPERVAFRLGENQYKLAFGPRFKANQHMPQTDWCVLLDGIYHTDNQLVAFTVLPSTQKQLVESVPQLFNTTTSLSLNNQKGQLEAREINTVGDSIFAQTPTRIDANFNWAQAWKHAIRSGELGAKGLLPLDHDGKQLQLRVHIAKQLGVHELSDVHFNDDYLLEHSELWLDSALSTCSSVKHIQSLPWVTLLSTLLSWSQQQALQGVLPSTYTVASGQQKPIVYTWKNNQENSVVAARVAVKLQAMFGVNQPVLLANGALPLTFELLSPAGRPLQTTQHLGEFWQGSYHELAKEMRGRYPKHPWPSDPANSEAMAGTKKAHGI